MYSFQSEGNNNVQTINYSENPINSFVRALWQNENYSEILEFTTAESENDPVLFYFHLKSLLEVRKYATIFTYLHIYVQLKSKNFENVLEIIEKKVKFSSDPFINYWYNINSMFYNNILAKRIFTLRKMIFYRPLKNQPKYFKIVHFFGKHGFFLLIPSDTKIKYQNWL